MKKQLILGSLLALAIAGNAQVTNVFPTPSGNVGVGNGSPFYKLDVTLGSQYDGVNINGNGATGNAGLFLNNTTNSTLWQLWNLGSTNAWGSGNFCIYDGSSSVPQIFINRSSGHVGFGTHTPDLTNNLAQLFSTYDVTPLGQGIRYSGAKGHVQSIAAIPPAGAAHTMVGVEGVATGYNNEAFAYGVYGSGANASSNYGGMFVTSGGAALGSNCGVDAEATSSSPSINYGIFAVAGNASSANYAGYFSGNVLRTGTDNFTSDQKLKNDIKSMGSTLDKIKLLNPCTYTFKTDAQFKNMNLPKGTQMGLIAQELEKVFPDLVNDNPAQTRIDEKGQKKEYIPEFKSVQYVALIPVLIAGNQEQQAQLDNQQKQMDAQNQLISELTNQLNNNAKTVSPTGIDAIQGATGFNMDQNVPNPFSSETVIKYTLSNQTKTASLIVYDLSGKQITSFTLDNNASSITITSEKLPAGIYIYSIMADGKIMDSKRMVVANK